MKRTFATVIIATISAALTQSSFGQSQIVIPSPLVAVDKAPVDRTFDGVASSPIVDLRFDKLAYETIDGLEELRINGFPSPIGPLNLNLVSFEILSDEADIVIGTAAGDVATDRPDVVLLRGSVAGVRDSNVFLGLSPLGSQGWIEMGDQRFLIASTKIAGELSTVIYDLDALPEGAIEWAPFECGTDELPPIMGMAAGETVASESVRSPSVLDAPDCHVVKIAIDSDYEYTESAPFYGDTTASQAYAYMLFGAIAEIYRRDFEAVLEVTFVRVWATNTDPYSGNSPGDRLNELRNWWRSNMGHIDRNNAHLLSGNGGGGVAWLGTLCGTNYGYAYSGVSGSFPYPLVHNSSQNWDVMVVSHELGHSFGANHTHNLCPPIDQCPPSNYWGACQTQTVCTDRGTIMSYCHLCAGGMRNIRLEFHERTIGVVVSRLANSSCLSQCVCYADCDQSTGAGVLDVFDFLCFQDSFVSGEPYACECDTSTGAGICDVFDFLCFQDSFVAGCP